MNYLKANLDNSLILPYDIMLDIYEYCDTLQHIRPLIKNGREYLKNIMCRRMEKIANDEHNDLLDGDDIRYMIMLYEDYSFITEEDILYYSYKYTFLKEIKTKVCGIDIHYWYNCGINYYPYQRNNLIYKINQDVELKHKMDVALGKRKRKIKVDNFNKCFELWCKL